MLDLIPGQFQAVWVFSCLIIYCSSCLQVSYLLVPNGSKVAKLDWLAIAIYTSQIKRIVPHFSRHDLQKQNAQTVTPTCAQLQRPCCKQMNVTRMTAIYTKLEINQFMNFSRPNIHKKLVKKTLALLGLNVQLQWLLTSAHAIHIIYY